MMRLSLGLVAVVNEVTEWVSSVVRRVRVSFSQSQASGWVEVASSVVE